MICFHCGEDAGNFTMCPACGADLQMYRRIIAISNLYYNDGLQKANVRNLSGAIVSLKACLKFNKYHIDARNLLGLIYYEIGEAVEALSEWVISKNYQQEENRASYYLDQIQMNQSTLATINQTIKKYNQALTYCRSDSRDLAVIQLKKVLSLNPNLVKGHQLLALLYLQDGRLEAAKKSLRNAGKIDTDNTLTLRYLKEVNLRLKETNAGKKTKNDDLISYQSGNETIIMPKRFKESSLGSSILYILLGLAVGVAVTCFLVVPNVKKKAQTDASAQLLTANDTIADDTKTISDLQDQIEELQAQIDSFQDNSDQVQAQIDSYEHLLMAYMAYDQQDVISAGNYLAKVEEEDLSDTAQEIYTNLNDNLSAEYLSVLYSQGAEAYDNEDYATAIEDMSAVTEQEMDYEDGSAAYYLAQSYRKSDNLEDAVPYYQYIVDNYPGTERAKTAENYVEE